MKTVPDSDDALLKVLAEDADSLWKNAAAHARARRRTQAIRARSALLVILLVIGAALWKTPRPTPSDSNIVVREHPQSPFPSRDSVSYVKVYSAETPPQTLEAPPWATKREQEILDALPEVPLLICRNAAGEVVQVHVFER